MLLVGARGYGTRMVNQTHAVVITMDNPSEYLAAA